MFGGLGGLLSAGVGLAGALGGKSGKYNPGQVSGEHLNQTPQYGYNAYNPFIQQGQAAQNQLNPQYDYLLSQRPDYQQMSHDPTGFLRGIESQYQETPFYQHRKKQLSKEAGNTAASGGFLGTENDVNQRSEMINALLNGDMQQFLNNVFDVHERGQAGQSGQYGMGLRGREQQVERGYGASGNLANYLKDIDMARAGYAGQAAGHRGEARGNVFSSLSSLINAGLMGGGGGRRGGFF